MSICMPDGLSTGREDVDLIVTPEILLTYLVHSSPCTSAKDEPTIIVFWIMPMRALIGSSMIDRP